MLHFFIYVIMTNVLNADLLMSNTTGYIPTSLLELGRKRYSLFNTLIRRNRFGDTMTERKRKRNELKSILQLQKSMKVKLLIVF